MQENIAQINIFLAFEFKTPADGLPAHILKQQHILTAPRYAPLELAEGVSDRISGRPVFTILYELHDSSHLWLAGQGVQHCSLHVGLSHSGHRGEK